MNPFVYIYIRDLTRFLIPHLFVGLVVPDVPLEETEILRKEAVKHNIELVCFLIFFPFILFVWWEYFKLFYVTFGCDCNTSHLLVWFPGITNYAHYTNWSDEGHCWSFRRIFVPGKIPLVSFIWFKVIRFCLVIIYILSILCLIRFKICYGLSNFWNHHLAYN